MKIIITGAGGLIGSAASEYFLKQGHEVFGIENNMRKQFFGEGGDTSSVTEYLTRYKYFTPAFVDIRDRTKLDGLFKFVKPSVVIHCAAQPSHDKAASIPFDDFDVNAVGTLNLLEMTRQHAKDAVFVFTSTNKVYGDSPNTVPIVELETRYDYDESYGDYPYPDGIAENHYVDQCMHSLFGASKLAADIMCQEYGRYFGLKTGIFRGGCLTGPNHAGVELHGFLSYLVKCAVKDIPYTIYGYKGKQVRDQIHSTDVIRAFEAFMKNPRPGEVYNIGGGRKNSASVLECISKLEKLTCKKMKVSYNDQARKGDHICYISDLTKLRNHYPEWDVRISLDEILIEMVRAEEDKCQK